MPAFMVRIFARAIKTRSKNERLSFEDILETYKKLTVRASKP
ncbi:MAG: hypothetical protein Q4D88_02700 [Anaerococcus sp.]|nr:hypothetical protein [Anaerococcus sp.]